MKFLKSVPPPIKDTGVWPLLLGCNNWSEEKRIHVLLIPEMFHNRVHFENSIRVVQ